MASTLDPERHALLKAAQAGDRQAFERLVKPLLPRLYGLCVHLTNNQDDAQDVLQETVLKAFRAIGSFREEAELMTWLGRIAKNATLDDFKRASKRYEEATEVLPEAPAERTVEPGLEQTELAGLVRAQVDQLSEKLRGPVLLYDLEGYSYEEIAEILDLNLGTVKSRLNRGRAALKEKLLAIKDRLADYLPPHLLDAAPSHEVTP